jgi:RNA-directed DNA polymerase
MEGKYEPSPVKRVEILKDSGGTRNLGIPFLGFTFTRMKLTATEKAINGFKARLRRLTGRSWVVSMQYRYASLLGYTRGWMNYFGVGMKFNDVVELDHWLRRRIRMCCWKQWRRARRRIGELIKLDGLVKSPDLSP